MSFLGAVGSGLLPNVRAQTPGQALNVAGQDVEVAISSVSRDTVRITMLPIQSGKAGAVPDDGALVKDSWPPAGTIRHGARAQSFKAGNLRVRFVPDPLSFTIQNARGDQVQQIRIDKDSGAVSFETGASPVLGLGQGGPQFDRRGNVDQMRSGQGGYRLATHGGKVPVQLMVGTGGWAMYIHQPAGSFDLAAGLSGKPGRFQPANPQAALPLDLFVIGTKDPAAVMGEYAKITGYSEMPPLWALGYQQSHRTLGSPDEIMQEAGMFREKKLPCEMMIYLGTGFCPNGWNTDNGEFTWNAKAFPDPKRAIQELHDQHFKVVLHIVIEGRRFTGRVTDPCTAPALPTGRTEDGRWPPDRQVSCYWPAHKPLLDLGVDGWWPDQGDGLDAASRLARNRMYFEGHQMYRPNERVYALHRNGSPGMQRIAAFLWSGDVQSTWETLKTHVPIAVNTGLSGIPYWGTDIGGFVPTQEYTGELYVRWFQFAAFNPLFRSHGREWRLHLPWGWNRGEIGAFRETPDYHPDPAELHNAAIEPICRKYLELRYRMMPYLYSAVRECTQTGMPIIRAMWLHYPDEAAAVERGDQYLWGRDMLVAPVVEKGAASRTLYLPRGTWYDFWTRAKVEGGREITRDVDLETMPLYVRAGAIIPMGPVKQYTEEKVDGPFEIHVYPGADGMFLLYEDDGKSFNFKKGEWTGIQMAWSDARRTLSMQVAAGSRVLGPPKRSMEVKLGDATKALVFEGRTLSVRF
jgi:alpha-glucosidase (family GH31 glycosyl hydrolase)